MDSSYKTGNPWKVGFEGRVKAIQCNQMVGFNCGDLIVKGPFCHKYSLRGLDLELVEQCICLFYNLGVYPKTNYRI